MKIITKRKQKEIDELLVRKLMFAFKIGLQYSKGVDSEIRIATREKAEQIARDILLVDNVVV